MNIAKYLRMTDNEKCAFFEQEEKKPTKEYDFKVSDAKSNMSGLFNGKQVNENPLTDIPVPEMRIYGVDDVYFDTEKDLVDYCRSQNILLKETYTLDYVRKVAGRSDVMRKTKKDGSFILYTAIEENGYGVYNYERSIYRGEFCWEFDYGSIAEMYSQFRNRGIVFENDIYDEIEKENRQLLKCVDF